MRRGIVVTLFFLLGITSLSGYLEWGFYGHRLINRMAVFTLPPSLVKFYKPNLEYISAHAVDADKRRYSSPHEAIRHYIDLDHWGEHPFPNLPRKWEDALCYFCDLHCFTESGDSLTLSGKDFVDTTLEFQAFDTSYLIDQENYRNLFYRHILPGFYDDPWLLDPDSFCTYLDLPSLAIKRIVVRDTFSGFGILPYHLNKIQNQLTQAFAQKDINKILRYSADLGHYLADAHVPLHTTVNYDGQLTDQVGIHAFWESRLPELFAEKQYDFFVGKASYISDPRSYYWHVVLETHQLVKKVLEAEKTLSLAFPADQQYCFDERSEQTIRTQCREYAEAYHDLLGGQVERQMQKSILAIGSAWYTAWIDGGQPDFASDALQLVEDEISDTLPRTGKNLPHARKHEGG